MSTTPTSTAEGKQSPFSVYVKVAEFCEEAKDRARHGCAVDELDEKTLNNRLARMTTLRLVYKKQPVPLPPHAEGIVADPLIVAKRQLVMIEAYIRSIRGYQAALEEAFVATESAFENAEKERQMLVERLSSMTGQPKSKERQLAALRVNKQNTHG